MTLGSDVTDDDELASECVLGLRSIAGASSGLRFAMPHFSGRVRGGTRTQTLIAG